MPKSHENHELFAYVYYDSIHIYITSSPLSLSKHNKSIVISRMRGKKIEC